MLIKLTSHKSSSLPFHVINCFKFACLTQIRPSADKETQSLKTPLVQLHGTNSFALLSLLYEIVMLIKLTSHESSSLPFHVINRFKFACSTQIRPTADNEHSSPSRPRCSSSIRQTPSHCSRCYSIRHVDQADVTQAIIPSAFTSSIVFKFACSTQIRPIAENGHLNPARHRWSSSIGQTY